MKKILIVVMGLSVLLNGYATDCEGCNVKIVEGQPQPGDEDYDPYEEIHYAYDRTTGYSWAFYVANDGTAELNGVEPEPVGVLRFPSSVTDNDTDESYEVTSVGHLNRIPSSGCVNCCYACGDGYSYSNFAGLTNMTAVILPSTIKTIGLSAFSGCTSLTSITLPSSVNRIAGSAFRNTGLIDFTIPSTVTRFSLSAFNNCKNLQSLIVEAKAVSSDCELSLYDCPKLTTLKLPEVINGLEDDDYYSVDFDDLQSLTTITLPEGVTDFSGVCNGDDFKSLTSAYFPSTLEYLGEAGLSNCWDLDKVVFAGDVPSDGDEGDIDGLLSVFAFSNSIYYPEEYAAHWRKIIRNLGYGGTHGVYAPSKLSLMKAIVKEAPKYSASGTPDFGPYVVGVAGTQTASSCAGYEMTGDIPAGLSWNSVSGTLSGAATKSGVFTVYVNSVAMTVRVDPSPSGSRSDDITPLDQDSITDEFIATKARTLNGCVIKNEEVLGSVQLKLGKVSKGKSKVSGSFLLFDGTKGTIPPTTVTVTKGAAASFTCSVKKFGVLTMTIGGDDFAGDLDAYHFQSGEIGFADKKSLAFSLMDAPSTIKGAVVQESCLPDGESIIVQNDKKFVLGKAASVKYKKTKDKTTKLYSYDFVVDTANDKKPNKSGLKLTYDAKKGSFKGSFKIYAIDEAKHKLITTTASVSGIMIDGKGYGTATAKKIGSWKIIID